ncbi:MAG: STAS domain-containing protein [Armatimonadetes bacterium]|nr:STAS domain-containing protein [Armatimonadota bacterium]
MRLSLVRENDIAILELKGKLDATTSKQFQEDFTKLIENNETKFIIDCSQLTYISSAGLRVFYFAAKKMENTNGEIVFCSTNPNIKRVFDIVDFASDFQILSDVDEALEIMK